MQDITQKITILLYTLILIFALTGLSIIAIFYLSFTLAYVLEPYLGGLIYSYALITGVIVLSGTAFYLLRKRLILQPLTRFLTNLFLEKRLTSKESPDSGAAIVWGIMGGIKMVKDVIRLFR